MHRLAVDLGTCNTVAVVARPGSAPRALLFDGSPVLPSAVFVDGYGSVHAGRDAERLMPDDPSRFEPFPKRRIDDGAVWLGDRAVPVADVLAGILRRWPPRRGWPAARSTSPSYVPVRTGSPCSVRAASTTSAAPTSTPARRPPRSGRGRRPPAAVRGGARRQGDALPHHGRAGAPPRRPIGSPDPRRTPPYGPVAPQPPEGPSVVIGPGVRIEGAVHIRGAGAPEPDDDDDEEDVEPPTRTRPAGVPPAGSAARSVSSS